jgi:hypothetical protein
MYRNRDYFGTVRFTIRGGRLRYKRYDAHFLKKSSVELPFSSFGDHLINEDRDNADITQLTQPFTDYVTDQWAEGDRSLWNHYGTEGPHTRAWNQTSSTDARGISSRIAARRTKVLTSSLSRYGMVPCPRRPRQRRHHSVNSTLY